MSMNWDELSEVYSSVFGYKALKVIDETRAHVMKDSVVIAILDIKQPEVPNGTIVSLRASIRPNDAALVAVAARICGAIRIQDNFEFDKDGTMLIGEDAFNYRNNNGLKKRGGAGDDTMLH